MPDSHAAEYSIQDRVSPEEWAIRVDLAALYRLCARHGMTDLTYTHLSARVPGDGDAFLLNPWGLLFEQVTASNLVKVDTEGNLLGENRYGVNAAGLTIHSAVHMARPDLACVAHTHTRTGIALAALPQGLRPLNQKAMQFHGRIAYHGYEGIAFDLDERERLIADMGDADVMVLKNHGFLVGGRSVREAWARLYDLEKAAKTQMLAEATGAPLATLSDAFLDEQEGRPRANRSYNPYDGWESQLRLLDRADSSWRH